MRQVVGELEDRSFFVGIEFGLLELSIEFVLRRNEPRARPLPVTRSRGLRRGAASQKRPFDEA